MADHFRVIDVVQFQELRGRQGPVDVWKVTAETTTDPPIQFSLTFETTDFEPEVVSERVGEQARKLALIRNL
jgi:hypothetical protein